jgi:hypothetical protein
MEGRKRMEVTIIGQTEVRTERRARRQETRNDERAD